MNGVSSVYLLRLVGMSSVFFVHGIQISSYWLALLESGSIEVETHQVEAAASAP